MVEVVWNSGVVNCTAREPLELTVVGLGDAEQVMLAVDMPTPVAVMRIVPAVA
jgi:hypothetical protein